MSLKESINKARFNHAAKQIRNTAPLNYERSEEVVIISMVGHATVDMYLIAIKSFMKHFGYGTVEAINDGSLTNEDIEVIQHHVPGVNFSNASEIETHGCPTYISWRRLFRAQQLSESKYVIQLDSDTISLGPLVDVNNLIKANKGFVIGSKRWSEAVDADFLSAITKQWNATQVQAMAEPFYNKIDFFKDGTKYLRGCAGFAGYPKGFASVEDIQSLSKQIEECIGKAWHGWGSEQAATLCLISKTNGSTILPWPMYQNYKFPNSTEDINSMNFVHFIGSNRFKDMKYFKLAKRLLSSLSN